MVTAEKEKVSTAALGEVVNTFREEAEKISSSPEEAEILATAALVNFLSKAKPSLLGRSKKLRKAAFASSLS